MKKFFEEFKAFALRGNVLDMAVGVIIGGAFTAIVTSLTENFIQPFLSFILGATGYQFYSWSQIAGFASNFLTSVVNFVITAFALFCLVKMIVKLTSIGKNQEEAAPTTKKCPYCKSEIAIDAVKCPHCTSDIAE